MMNRYLRNSEWEKRFAHRATARELLVQVAGGTLPLEDFLGAYRTLVLGYLNWFLARHKLAADEAARAVASERIWAELLAALPGKIDRRWSRGGVTFRELLREAVHEATFAWSHPHRTEAAVQARISPDSGDDEELRRRIRADLIEKGREQARAAPARERIQEQRDLHAILHLG